MIGALLTVEQMIDKARHSVPDKVIAVFLNGDVTIIVVSNNEFPSLL